MEDNRIKIEYTIETQCSVCNGTVDFPIDFLFNNTDEALDVLFDPEIDLELDVFSTMILDKFPNGICFAECPNCKEMNPDLESKQLVHFKQFFKK